MLVDDGPHRQGDELLSFLGAQRVIDITMTVLTHADMDHVGGLDPVLRNLTVDRAWLGDPSAEERNQA